MGEEAGSTSTTASPGAAAERGRRMLRNTGVYAIGEGLLQVLSAVLAPVLTWLLPTRELGIWGLGLLLLTGLNYLYNPALHGAINRFFYDHEHDEIARRRFQSSIFTFLLVWSLGLSILLSLVGPWLLSKIAPAVAFRPDGLLIVWTAFFTIFSVVPTTTWIAKEASSPYVAVRAAGTVIFLGASVGLVATTHLGATSLFLARFASVFVVGVFLGAHSFRHAGLGWSRRDLGKAFAFSLPLVPHLLSHWVLALADRFMIEHYLGIGAVGVYTAAYAFIEAVNLVATSLNRAWVPVFTRAFGDPAQRAFVGRTITYFVAGVALASLAATILASPLVHGLFGPGYAGAALVAPILGIGGIFQGLYYVYVGALFYQRDNRLLPFITGTAAIVNVGLNVVLIPRWGIAGAAWATLVGYLVLLAGTRWAANRLTDLPFERRRLTKLAFIVVAAGVAGLSLDRLGIGWGAEIGLDLVLLAVAIVALFATRFVTGQELLALRRRR